ncbi:hypothetical protein CPB84DRAFT_1767153 [Gymnopilus junonius]|uniref:Uncharacterized protein n=1 Tax=Gymnopilus junonius TaxID=109634 RepID=A0A9P5NXI0_GYMJU|nr:hypothetical protein CPB84DRAFT_1767153 [Gymnopilus junonius]
MRSVKGGKYTLALLSSFRPTYLFHILLFFLSNLRDLSVLTRLIWPWSVDSKRSTFSISQKPSRVMTNIVPIRTTNTSADLLSMLLRVTTKR